jgi:signal transduction histidine kinase
MNNYEFSVISLFFMASSFVSFFVSYLGWQRKSERGATELSHLMSAAGLWAFFVIFETAALDLEDKILWSKIAYLGALSTPLFYFFFVLRYIGKDKYLTRKYYLLFSIVPFVVFLFTITNEYHGLVWTGFAPVSPVTNLTQYYHGIVFWIGNVGYNYFLFAVATIYLIRFIFMHLPEFKAQAKLILAASLCPWISSLFYVTSHNIVPGVDLVPLSMILSGTLLAYAIFHNRFLDIVPVAREILLESLREGIIVIDRNNRIQDINKAALRFMNMEQNKVIGSDFSGFTFAGKFLREIVDSSRDTIVVEDGIREAKRYYLVETQEVKNYPGSRLIVLKDETDEVRREKEMLKATRKAEESDRLKSSFLANLSHEIRTPVNVINGFLDLLKGVDFDSDDKEIYLEMLRKSSDRILSTFNDIIEISKIEAGQTELEESQMNLNEIVDYLYKLNYSSCSEKGIGLISQKGLDNKSSLIYADRVKIIAVMHNLLKNAIKYTDKGRIKFGYDLFKGNLVFYVDDTGIGIPEERQSLVFNRFMQAEQSMNRPYEGSGLGLSIVKGYVEMMGGEISLHSVPGEGSRFSFSLQYRPVFSG